MTVYLVGAGPGDPGLLTVRGSEVLARAEVVVYDRLSIADLLEVAPGSALRVSVGKTPRGPGTPQSDINRMLVEHGLAGRTVVRLKGGDPFVFARGGEEAAALAAAGVPFEVVPGVSSAIAVPAYAGVPVTQRGMATSFTVVTGHEDPWAATETDWDAVARVGGTTVVLMGVATRGEIARRLMAAGRPGETPVAAVQWGTRPAQHTVRTTLAGLGAARVEAPATIVIGAVAGLDLAWFERRPLWGRRVVVTRARDQAGDLRRRLAEQGAVVVEVPTIAVEPTGHDLAGRLPGAEWVVLTSANAVAQLCGQMHDARGFGGARVAAVGPATADALGRFGVRADLVPDEAVAEALVAAFPLAGEGGGPAGPPPRVLLPVAGGSRPALAEGLRAKGWEVETVVAYRTVAVPLTASELESVAGADAAVFTSPSTLAHLVAAAGTGGLPPVVVCIGPVTAAEATRSGVPVAAVADPHTDEGLVAAVVAALGPPPPGGFRAAPGTGRAPGGVERP